MGGLQPRVGPVYRTGADLDKIQDPACYAVLRLNLQAIYTLQLGPNHRRDRSDTASLPGGKDATLHQTDKGTPFFRWQRSKCKAVLPQGRAVEMGRRSTTFLLQDNAWIHHETQ